MNEGPSWSHAGFSIEAIMVGSSSLSLLYFFFPVEFSPKSVRKLRNVVQLGEREYKAMLKLEWKE